MRTTTSTSKTIIVLCGAFLLPVCVITPTWACHDHPNPVAFQRPLSNESDLLPNGMMAVIYKHANGEEAVHVTVHRIHMILAGYHPMLPERRDPQYTVLQTDGTINPMTYVIMTNALYYGIGQDALGFPTKTWIDPAEDGLNGNERASFQTAQR